MHTQPSTHIRHNPTSVPLPSRRRRAGRTMRLAGVAGSVVAGAMALSVTFGAGEVTAAPDTPATTFVDQSGVAAWAKANALHGLSPTSVSATPDSAAAVFVDQSGVAAWAEANALHGLSPASVSAGPDTPAGN